MAKQSILIPLWNHKKVCQKWCRIPITNYMLYYSLGVLPSQHASHHRMPVTLMKIWPSSFMHTELRNKTFCPWTWELLLWNLTQTKTWKRWWGDHLQFPIFSAMRAMHLTSLMLGLKLTPPGQILHCTLWRTGSSSCLLALLNFNTVNRILGTFTISLIDIKSPQPFSENPPYFWAPLVALQSQTLHQKVPSLVDNDLKYPSPCPAVVTNHCTRWSKVVISSTDVIWFKEA